MRNKFINNFIGYYNCHHSKKNNNARYPTSDECMSA